MAGGILYWLSGLRNWKRTEGFGSAGHVLTSNGEDVAPTFQAPTGGGVPTTRTLTAGAGLTGGGDLSADRTFDVGAGTGITVNANDVAVNQSVLKLDDFAATDDNTDLDASTTKHGLMPKWTSALISALLDLISTTRGAILYRGASAWAALLPGDNAGDVLTTFGSGADPAWRPSATGPVEQTSFLVSGGQVVWTGGLSFRVSAAAYYIAGTRYTSTEQTITLDAADPSDDRIDVLALDTSGTLVKVTGTPAANPSKPDIDPGSQLELTFVVVQAGATTPEGAASTLLYSENAGSGGGPAEWDWTASAGTVALGSTNNPRTGSVSIEGTTVANGTFIQGTIGAGSLDPTDYDTLVFYVRPKAAWPNARSFSVRWYTGTVAVGSAVVVTNGTFGFDSAVINTYQQVAIPLSLFALPAGTLITRVRITRNGSGTNGWNIDDISLIGVAPSPVGGLTQDQADARYAPLGPSFVTIAAESGLPNERRLVAGTGISVTDGGAGSTVTIAATAGGSGINQLTGDVTAGPGTGSQAATIANDAVTNAKLADMAQSTIKGRAAGAGTGDPTDLTSAQATAVLDTMVGDSGSGGTKGLVHAPAAGDSAAGKFYKADGTWQVPSGSGGITELTGDVTAGPGSGAQAATLATNLKRGTVGAVLVAAGDVVYVEVPYACTITAWRIVGTDAAGVSTSGSAVVDVWKDSYANYPPTVADTIAASAKPTLSSAAKNQDTTLTGWTTAVSAGDWLAFKLESMTTISRVLVQLTVTKTP